jgi:release factor glutamine methyltransferase
MSRFEAAGISSSRLDAEILLSNSLGTDRLHLYLDPDRPASPPERERFRQLVKQRLDRCPVAYLTGIKEFWSIPFHVDRNVLIPRPETEVLIEVAVRCLIKRTSAFVVDAGTGSGCIMIALAKELPHARIMGLDYSWNALAVTRRNAMEAHITDQINLICGNWFEAIREFPGNGIDAIVSNPPYIPTGDIESLPPEIRDYEPLMALDGGPEGLDIYPILAENAMRLLNPEGFLCVEIGTAQAEPVTKILQDKGLHNLHVFKDYSGYDRIITGNRS